MAAQLRVVESELKEPPYPSDTQVKGWRFELDVERVRRSDTWALCAPEMRPWLLMLWMTAWDQQPAGSLPADHRIISAHIGMPERVFSANADILLRGFVQHSDGRLYHPVVVEQVLALVEKRESAKDRKARWRAENCPTSVPRDTHGTDAGLTRSHTGKTLPEPVPEPVINTQPTAESAKTSKVSAPKPPPPYAQIRNLWCEILPELPQPHGCEHWTDARKAQIRARWYDQLPDLESWRACFSDIRKSKFLMGKVQNGDRKVFRCDLFWITKPENLLRLQEGRYFG